MQHTSHLFILDNDLAVAANLRLAPMPAMHYFTGNSTIEKGRGGNQIRRRRERHQQAEC